jgi:4-hydroxy-tetrahydrodipicolinate synthase
LRLSGSITALATPFTAAGELDLDAWQRLLQAQVEGGTQGVVVAGSTGEAAALYDAEYDVLLRTAVELVAGRIPVLAGTGLSNTAKTIELSRRAATLGADAALVVTPPYVRPTQAGLLAHYRALADDGALPVVLYNVPGRTGCDLSPDTAAELALLPLRSEGFVVLSGDDPTAARALLTGADGVISVASNVVPAALRTLCDLARGGRHEQVNELDGRLHDLYDFLGAEPNPIPVKAILALQGIGHRQGLRLPLTPLADAHTETARRLHDAIRTIETSCRNAIAA